MNGNHHGIIREMVESAATIYNQSREETLILALVLGLSCLLKDPEAEHNVIHFALLDKLDYTKFTEHEGNIALRKRYSHKFERPLPVLCCLPTGNLFLARMLSQYQLVDSDVGLQIVG